MSIQVNKFARLHKMQGIVQYVLIRNYESCSPPKKEKKRKKKELRIHYNRYQMNRNLCTC